MVEVEEARAAEAQEETLAEEEEEAETLELEETPEAVVLVEAASPIKEAETKEAETGAAAWVEEVELLVLLLLLRLRLFNEQCPCSKEARAPRRLHQQVNPPLVPRTLARLRLRVDPATVDQRPALRMLVPPRLRTDPVELQPQ